MSDALDDWPTHQRDRMSGLVTLDDGTPVVFEDLCRWSEPQVLEAGLRFLPVWDAASLATPSTDPDRFGLDEDLAYQWRWYAVRWQIFMAANPGFWCWWLLKQLARSDGRASLDHTSPSAVRTWVRSGFADRTLVRDTQRIQTTALRSQLVDLDRQVWVTRTDDGRYAWTVDGNRAASPES